MKLRNKKTGGLANIDELCVHTDAGFHDYASLAELNEEWEDYEEPKEYWTIDWTCTGVTTNRYSGDDVDDFNKEIGNYFETKEEAEKAVEKLKAWKRLKDKGFRFDGKTLDTAKRFGSIFYWLDENAYSEDYIDDLNLVFGGEV